MAVTQWFKQLLTKKNDQQSYQFEADFEGITFILPKELTEKIQQGKASEWLTHQHISLTMLVEQESAEAIPNGFIVPSEVITQLEPDVQALLGLPEPWKGCIEGDVKSTTSRATFNVQLKVETPRGGFSSLYQVEGPILKFGASTKFLLTPAQLAVFNAQKSHSETARSEYDNLNYLFALQHAQELGCKLNLGHFEKLDVKAPESISIEAELDAAGNLILTPYMGQDSSHEKIERVLGQLKSAQATSLRVGNEIILFDDKKIEAVNEVLNNRVVPKHKVKQFLEQPTAFIDASLVDLDLGFSVRVKGATKFKHAYFGETDESGIDWFGKNLAQSIVIPVNKLESQIKDKETFEQVKQQLSDAEKSGAQEFDFEDSTYDISDTEQVKRTIEKVTDKLNGAMPLENDAEEDFDDIEPLQSNDTAVIDIELNDDDLEVASRSVEQEIDKILYPKENLTWDNYARKPFPHQLTGVQWLVGLARAQINDELGGGLLADDMGLGKTFMGLSAVDQLYKIAEQDDQVKKPTLIVAPLSLLENWKDEIDVTFNSSPFSDVVILQSAGDLNKFRVGGVETKNQDFDDEAEIHYSLKVGKNFGDDRLDLPQRVVITTYQTLRDYQFSMCLIDWGMVIFDEAQNIKNPNALQTRAAKGLKADFKLIATGTPVENTLADFWCLMDTACPGYLESYQSFRQNYVTPILQAASDEVDEIRAKVGRNLRDKVGALMLRRVKEDNLKGLPDKNFFVGVQHPDWDYEPSLDSMMTGKQLDTYDETITLRARSEGNQVLAALQRLRDVSLHPRLADRGQLQNTKTRKELEQLIAESAKMQSLINTLKLIQSREEKVIIFTVNKRLQAFLSYALGQIFALGPLSIINGDAKAVAKRKSVPTRKSMIKDFENKEGFNIIIMSPVAAGVGLTVVGANNVIHFERHWNPAKEAQATDRVYRIGQTKDVNIYIPVLHHPNFESFDVNLNGLLFKKTQLKDAIITPSQIVPDVGSDISNVEPSKLITKDDLAKLSWQQFEAFCAELLVKHYQGNSCWLTQNGSDYGADAVVITDSEGYLIQVKHTINARFDGYKAIQEVHAAKVIYEKELGRELNNLIFITNAQTLVLRTKEIAKEYGVQVLSLEDIEAALDLVKVTYSDLLSRLNKARLAVK